VPAHDVFVWLSNGVWPAGRRWQEVAQEGSAALEVGMPFPSSIDDREGVVQRVVIGVDPPKRSHAIEVMHVTATAAAPWTR
jgi:hypothetical protein